MKCVNSYYFLFNKLCFSKASGNLSKKRLLKGVEGLDGLLLTDFFLSLRGVACSYCEEHSETVFNEKRMLIAVSNREL